MWVTGSSRTTRERERELEEELLVSPQFHLARDTEINLPLCVTELSIVMREREARQRDKGGEESEDEEGEKKEKVEMEKKEEKRKISSSPPLCVHVYVQARRKRVVRGRQQNCFPLPLLLPLTCEERHDRGSRCTSVAMERERKKEEREMKRLSSSPLEHTHVDGERRKRCASRGKFFFIPRERWMRERERKSLSLLFSFFLFFNLFYLILVFFYI